MTDASKREVPSPLWCANDTPHDPHGARNKFGGWNHCTGRPVFEKAHTPAEPKCGGARTNCRHDQHPPMHSAACPVSQASTPSDDERACEPSDDEREALNALAEYGRSQPNDYERAYADPLAEALRVLLRRPEVPEPQDEPTDAQVRSARKAHRQTPGNDDDKMRAALRAAGEVKVDLSLEPDTIYHARVGGGESVALRSASATNREICTCASAYGNFIGCKLHGIEADNTNREDGSPE